MRWSKLESAIRDRIAPELRRRVRFHFTTYREQKSNFQGRDYGRFWITIDKAEVYSRNCRQYRNGDDRVTSDSVEAYRQLGFYLSMDIREAQQSHDSIIKSLAILASRTGLRLLRRMNVNADHELVRTCYELRLSVFEAKRAAGESLTAPTSDPEGVGYIAGPFRAGGS